MQEYDFSKMEKITDPSMIAQLETPQTSINTQVNKNPRGLTGQQYVNVRKNYAELQVAQRQLDRMKEEWNKSQRNKGLSSVWEYNPFNADNKVFDKTIDGFRSTMRKITKTPGEGSISDYETKLQQLELPDRWSFDEANLESFRNIEDRISSTMRMYEEVLGLPPQLPKAPPSNRQAPKAMPPGVKIRRIK